MTHPGQCRHHPENRPKGSHFSSSHLLPQYDCHFVCHLATLCPRLRGLGPCQALQSLPSSHSVLMKTAPGKRVFGTRIASCLCHQCGVQRKVCPGANTPLKATGLDLFLQGLPKNIPAGGTGSSTASAQGVWAQHWEDQGKISVG